MHTDTLQDHLGLRIIIKTHDAWRWYQTTFHCLHERHKWWAESRYGSLFLFHPATDTVVGWWLCGVVCVYGEKWLCFQPLYIKLHTCVSPLARSQCSGGYVSSMVRCVRGKADTNWAREERHCVWKLYVLIVLLCCFAARGSRCMRRATNKCVNAVFGCANAWSRHQRK